jgi:hypothetical protein
MRKIFTATYAKGSKTPIGITEQNSIFLRYSFLKEYKMLWNYEATNFPAKKINA